jgi:hypothetical protein
MWKCIHVKYPLFLLDFNKTWIFSTDFRKELNIKFHQNPSTENEQFHADGRTDIKLIVAFRTFANAPKSENGHIIG